MSQRARPFYTPAEYFSIEEHSAEKHEYYEGEIYLMSGGSLEHGQIASNVNFALKQALRGRGCRVYTSDVEVGMTSPAEFYTYPDISVVCGQPESLSGQPRVLANPLLLVEVLSPSTATYDATTKFALYKNLLSFKHYLLVEQERVGVVYHYKTADGIWQSKSYAGLEERLTLNGFEDISLSVADFYDQIEFKL